VRWAFWRTAECLTNCAAELVFRTGFACHERIYSLWLNMLCNSSAPCLERYSQKVNDPCTGQFLR
jgi:hypothetical protein